MHPSVEVESTRAAALAAASRVWGWEIPVYLFLGGLVAGLMLAVAAAALLAGRERVTSSMKAGLVAAPLLLSLGMGALFLDLTFKLHVLRFYTTLELSAPMSLGSWVLLLVYPVQLLMILALPHDAVVPTLKRFAVLSRAERFARAHSRVIFGSAITLGIALGLYTGVLLSATVARPMWSSAALALLFLVSGASTGVAALMLGERDHAAHGLLSRADVLLIGIELVIIGLWLIGLATQSPAHQRAAALVLTGSYAPVFVGMVVFGGLLLPAALELLSLRGKALSSRAVPALVLVGGLLLRFVVVYAGQDTRFGLG